MELFDKNISTKISKLKRKDLKEYLNNLKNFYLNYEATIDVNKDYTFGCEIEYRGIDKFFIDKFIKALPEWKSIIESNIVCGGEAISPILVNKKEAWKEIEVILTYLNYSKANERDTGAHIHIGADILGSDINAWKNFIYLYVAFEDILYRFYNGEYINGREKQKSMAYPIGIEMANSLKNSDLHNIDDLKNILKQENRFQGVNFKNVNYDLIDDCIYKNTIELRMPNGTLKKEIWQNNINFILHFIDKCKNGEFDNEYLLYKINKIANYNNYNKYDNMDLNSALYLADIIFDNNYEKAKFLVQYYKDGKTTNNLMAILSTKKLVKY